MQNYRNASMPNNNYRSAAPCAVEATRRTACDVRDITDSLKDMPIAMAYVPWQRWRNIYDAEKGFCNGTIFQDLNLPFIGMGGCQK